MAFLQVNFYSKCLKRLVNFNAVLPIDTIEIPGTMEAAPKGPMRAMYLLHGYSGAQHDWICGSKIQELSLKHNIAVFMPSGDNSFYLDDTDMGALYGEFIGREFVEVTRKMFNLSDKREDTFIGGLSMGGYGAIRNGLKYADTFGRIIALSSALITYNIAGIPEDYKDPVADYKYYTRVFGDLNKLIGSDKDPEAIAHSLKESGADIPQIYMACGTEDFLLNENRKFHSFLTSENIEHTYEEGPGIHDWTFWNEYIEKAIEWTI
ncbi:alpha/beta hydrolase [Clostridium hydrogenum]|uniref:alpha/beta hydrolase n=1 Tax=Clostridium hydrogenum TaxID=2855764 RepID=UPI001EEB2EBB|nr:alpha/beta hydrolase-fold protein [Clostridium hydrogenum]